MGIDDVTVTPLQTGENSQRT